MNSVTGARCKIWELEQKQQVSNAQHGEVKEAQRKSKDDGKQGKEPDYSNSKDNDVTETEENMNSVTSSETWTLPKPIKLEELSVHSEVKWFSNQISWCKV